MTDLATTRARISDLRRHVWDLDGCYALDKLIDAAAALQQAAPYFSDDEARVAKINRHLRALALAIAAQYPAQSSELRDINTGRDRADARSKAMREDA
jgi:hypothetical protein